MSSYATKLELKKATEIVTSYFALKSNLARLKLDIDKLVPIPVDLSKLKLVTKVNSIDTTGFILKTRYDTDKSDLEKKISDAEKK